MTDKTRLTLPAEYGPLLEELKERIRSAQVRAATSVNQELTLLYWGIGKRILQGQIDQGWGSQVVRRLSQDLTAAFPGMKGFSPRNLEYMRAFARSWPDEAVLQAVLAKLTWYHNLALLEKLDDPQLRFWYAGQALANGWSRNVLVMQIETRLHQRLGAAPTNFVATLPAPQSDLAHNLLKDPYNFDFLHLGQQAQEREIEAALLTHIQRFLLELGVGFAFLGRQYRLEVAGEEFFLDLLFYHVRLHCYVVIEVKATSFQPEYAGKLNFYLSAADDVLRIEGDAPTIGILLCKEKNRVLAEYALRDLNKPIGVASYQLTDSLPEDIRTALPTIEELEQELQQDLGDASA